jgi:cysteine desulfurase
MWKRRIYLDSAAGFANASSIHTEGVASRKAVEAARARVASVLSAHPDEIVFASTGTEADNLAILGCFDKAVALGAGGTPHIVTLLTEHPAVLERYRHLEKTGAEVTYVPVGADGRVDPKAIRAALRPETVIVSVMYANNEIGVIHPIKEIAKEIRAFKKHAGGSSAYPLFHTDACQAAPYLNMNVEQLGVDLLTFSGIKLGAGHGASVLYVRRGTPIAPVLFGGEQERGLRPGTENVPAIVALSVAFEAAQKNRERESERLLGLRDFFTHSITKKFPEARINGSLVERLPNNVHVSFPGITSELLVLELDARGIAASAGSACSSAKESGSSVLSALYGAGDEKKWGSVRFSFGFTTKKRHLEATLAALRKILKKYKEWHK